MITLPPPTRLELAVHSAFRKIQRALRRIDPFFRPTFNPILREPAASAIQWVMNLLRKNEGFKLAEERALPGEEESLELPSSRPSPLICGRTTAPASINAAATPRRMASCAANSSCAMTCLRT